MVCGPSCSASMWDHPGTGIRRTSVPCIGGWIHIHCATGKSFHSTRFFYTYQVILKQISDVLSSVNFSLFLILLILSAGC